MNQESLAKNEAWILRIALKLNSDLWPPGYNLEALFGTQVLTDGMGHEIAAVKNGQDVSVANI